MKITLCVLALATFNATAQTSAVTKPDRETLRILGSYINADSSHLLVSSVTEKRILRLGDAAAVAINQLTEGKTITEEQGARILEILRMAFERPSVVTLAADRKPVVATALIQRFRQESWSPKMMSEVEDAAQEISANSSR